MVLFDQQTTRTNWIPALPGDQSRGPNGVI